MSDNKPQNPHELPRRARVGYVIKYCNVKQGELNPSNIFWIMEHRGLADYDDAEAWMDLIDEVMIHSTEVDYDGE